MRDVTGPTLAKVQRENVDTSASVLHTDAAPQYRDVGGESLSQEGVDHSSYEYVLGDVSTNQCEGFAHPKRQSDGVRLVYRTLKAR